MANATDSTSRLFQAVRETQDEQLRLADANEQARARARLLQAVDQVDAQPTVATVNDGNGARPGAAWRWGLGGLLVAACAFAVVFVLPEDLAGDLAGDLGSEDPVGDEDKHEFESAALEFRLDGGLLAANQSIDADDRARSLSVSDSTSIELAPHGRMYLEEIRANGATVVLEQGEVSLAVHHQDNTSWRVAAGPWTVHVTGTQFVVAWEPNDSKFRVAVLEGSVRVEGPEGEIAQLRAGDKLVRARAKATLEPETLGSQDPKPAVAPEIAGANPALNPALNSSGTSKPAAPGWDHFFNASDYQTAWEVLADQAGGIHGAAEQAADARTMLDLADVARFTKHGNDTRKVLERLRVRFPHSGEASEAAFALGRLAADGGSLATATGWFELYLDERPNGSFAGDALGRLLDCYETLGKTEKAESAAELYLARNPKGPHADKAEKILAQ